MVQHIVKFFTFQLYNIYWIFNLLVVQPIVKFPSYTDHNLFYGLVQQTFFFCHDFIVSYFHGYTDHNLFYGLVQHSHGVIVLSQPLQPLYVKYRLILCDIVINIIYFVIYMGGKIVINLFNKIIMKCCKWGIFIVKCWSFLMTGFIYNSLSSTVFFFVVDFSCYRNL